MTCFVFVKKGKRQLLQMGEHIAAHIALHPNADYMPPIGNDIVQHRFEGIYQQQHARPHRQQAQVAVRNIIVDNAFCYKRIKHIAHRYQKRAQHIEKEKPFMRLVIAYKFPYHARSPHFRHHDSIISSARQNVNAFFHAIPYVLLWLFCLDKHPRQVYNIFRLLYPPGSRRYIHGKDQNRKTRKR